MDRILLAEDEPVVRLAMARTLRKLGYEVVETADGAEAWLQMQRDPIALVVADWEMPEMTGVDLVRKIRADKSLPYIYFILLTGRTEKQSIVQGIDAGADDYITKPPNPEELKVRINAGKRILAMEAELLEKNRQLERMSKVDGLTGIPNRRDFDDRSQQEYAQARRHHLALSLAMIDIDHFKRYNDTLGHLEGDEALRRVARLLDGAKRDSDMVFRYGGEEFVCLFPRTDANGALAAGERMRQVVELAAIPHPGNPPVGIVTVSVGVATLAVDGTQDATGLRERADQALYRAKHEGRNRVAAWAAPAQEQPAGERADAAHDPEPEPVP